MDASFADSVKDSPMASYTLLEPDNLAVRNGNLVGYHNGSGGEAFTEQTLELDGKYYFEATVDQNVNEGMGILNTASIGNPASGPQAGFYGIFSYLASGYERYNDSQKTVISAQLLDPTTSLVLL